MGSYLLVLLLIHVIQCRKKKDVEDAMRAAALDHVRAKEKLILEKLKAEQGIESGAEKKDGQEEGANPAVKPRSDDDEYLGQLFVDFFSVVGLNLDYSRGISVREGGSLFPKATR
jgi:DNA polymerase sigma